MSKPTILFLTANPLGTDRLALDEEARAIQVALERGVHRDFELSTRWAMNRWTLGALRPLLDELRRFRPTIVHFRGHGVCGAFLRDQGICRDISGDLDGDSGTVAANFGTACFRDPLPSLPVQN